jgi:hypothetical protein
MRDLFRTRPVRALAAVYGALAVYTAARRHPVPAILYTTMAAGIGWLSTQRGSSQAADLIIRVQHRRGGWAGTAGQLTGTGDLTLDQIRVQHARAALEDARTNPLVDDLIYTTMIDIWEHTGKVSLRRYPDWAEWSDWQRGWHRYNTLTGVANAVITDMEALPDSPLHEPLIAGHTRGSIELAALCCMADSSLMLMT